MPARKNTLADKRILIIHFRVGRTDGVSLEIAAWKEILENAGATVALCGGPVSIGADYVIPDLEQQLNREMYLIDEDAFGGVKHHQSEDRFVAKLLEKETVLMGEFERVIRDFDPHTILVANIFSVGEGFPVAPALTKVLDSHKIHTVTVNHDFTWENERYKEPTNALIERYLDEFYPPVRDYMRYFTINSIGQRAMRERKDIKTKILYDTFDFDQPHWKRKSHITRFLKNYSIHANDMVFLQATRIVRRKNIELSIDLVSEFCRLLSSQKSRSFILHDKRTFNISSDSIHLVLSGYVERRDRSYLEQLKEHATRLNVNFVYLGDHIDEKYCLWDIYPYADIITFPSEYEGFGNQVLEGFFARKPIVLFEYPVYKSDIRPKNFDVISLGDQLIQDRQNGLKRVPHDRIHYAAHEVFSVLTSPEEYHETVIKNFLIGKAHYSNSHSKETSSRRNYYQTVTYNFNLSSKNFSYENALKVLRDAMAFEGEY